MSDDPGPGSRHLLLQHQVEELALLEGFVYATVAFMIPLVIAALVGQQVGGRSGRTVGIDVGLGIAAFVYMGTVIHGVRYIALLIYSRIVTHRSTARPEASFPGTFLRHILTSSDWDFLVQVAGAVVAGLFFVHIRAFH